MQLFEVFGKITDIELVDMVEDGDGDLDILVATEHLDTVGGIELWHKEDDGAFGLINGSEHNGLIEPRR